ncbi:unnamed protein product [Lathyrus sativus]|nr:unnamed protein product [Lathyrus sativus]
MASDKSTMDSVVSAQHGLYTVHELMQIANITMLKIWSILISKADKHARTVMVEMGGLAFLLAVIPFKFFLMGLIVLHRDIKGSNLLVDNEGVIRIADFGLASFFDPKHKQPMTSRVVTLWYRSSELLLGATDYDVGVDLWSAGCILAELLAGRPIMPGRTEVEQLHKIFKLCGSPSEEY